jgi:hypothetical protein
MAGLVSSVLTTLAVTWLLAYTATHSPREYALLAGGALGVLTCALCAFLFWTAVRTGVFPRHGSPQRAMRVAIGGAVLLLSVHLVLMSWR